MKAFWWIVLGIGAGVAALKGVQALKTVADIYNKIKYSFSNIRVSLSGTTVTMKTDINITNLSNLTVPLKNLSVLCQAGAKPDYQDVAYTKQSIPEVTLKANQTITVKDLTLDISALTIALELYAGIMGKIKELKFTTSFYVLDQEQKIETVVPISDLKFGGLSGVTRTHKLFGLVA